MAVVTAGADSRAADRAFCREMLPRVSRTFAICIRLLPAGLDAPVRIAYLLCRVADTIEDSVRLDVEDKVRLLHRLRTCIDVDGPDAEPLRESFASPRGDEERLAHEADIVLREFRRLPTPEQEAIRPWVQEMCTGMADFARRKGASADSTAHIEALTTVEELDRYCYYVAGTVGHLLTALFRLHAAPRQRERYRRLDGLATSFGLGLQLTNIIKDVADDRRRGWSFVPQELCQLAGITAEELHDGRHRDASLRVMHRLIAKAKHHLLDALEYSTLLSRRQYGVRLFCLTALYFAVQTLELAERDDRLLDPDHKVKISRSAVLHTIAMTRLVAPSNALVRWQFRRLARTDWDRGPPGIQSACDS
ncbi:MAG: phytoene/squalene synthase family protein [Gemmatimonadales bacterium]|nr:phytoene/squalene synthase family protein [Gemmatimonadales bacterium]